MKLLVTVFFLLFVGFFVGCRPSSKVAAQYNDNIIAHQLKIVAIQKELNEAINAGQVKDIKTILEKFKLYLKNESDSIAATEVFDGKDDFKKGTLNYMDQLITLGNNEYTSISQLFEIPDTLFNNENEKKTQALLLIIQDKTSSAFKALENEQLKFAKENNFQIIKKIN